MKKRILLVDDEPHNLEILRIFLRSLNYDIYEAECGEQALLMVDQVHPDVILLDVMMPDLSGFIVAKRWRERSDFHIPIIFLSAKVQKEDMMLGLQLGATDYLTKPFDLDLLEKKVSIVLEHRAKLQELQKENAHLSALAYIDSLTGLYNRTYLTRVEQLAATGQGRSFAKAMMVDVDHFKDINDNFGHLVGDLVLKETSRVILSHIDIHQDLAFRYGGDEFLVLLGKGDDALQLAQAILQDITGLAIQTNCDQPVRATVSIGLSTEAPQPDLAAVIAGADNALYSAKHHGRNRVFGC